MQKLTSLFEKYVSYILIGLVMVFITYQVIELIWMFCNRLYAAWQGSTFESPGQGHPVAALFFSILIMFEIIQTIKVFSYDHLVKIRIIIIVGLIAVTRKILLLDLTEAGTHEAFAVAALIIALSVGYYLVGKNAKEQADLPKPE